MATKVSLPQSITADFSRPTLWWRKAQIWNELEKFPVDQQLSELSESLGESVASFVVGFDPESALSTAESNGEFSQHADRIRGAWVAAALMRERYDVETARNWMFGKNPDLDDQSPADVIRGANGRDEITPVITAARKSVEN